MDPIVRQWQEQKAEEEIDARIEIIRQHWRVMAKMENDVRTDHAHIMGLGIGFILVVIAVSIAIVFATS